MPNHPQKDFSLGVLKVDNDWKNTGRRLKIRYLDPDYEIDGETGEHQTYVLFKEKKLIAA